MFLENERTNFIIRILKLKEIDKSKFGKMNVNQMICHCSDQFRMLFGEIEGLKKENVDLMEMRNKIQRKESVQIVEGLDQVAGDGTKPKEFKEDIETLIEYINKFSK